MQLPTAREATGSSLAQGMGVRNVYKIIHMQNKDVRNKLANCPKLVGLLIKRKKSILKVA